MTVRPEQDNGRRRALRARNYAVLIALIVLVIALYLSFIGKAGFFG